ncbi:transposable element Tcb2 transposase [Trichonephila clavipes]|nr:transposable element Tcb2 transposase [Trichonephila clavipes]
MGIIFDHIKIIWILSRERNEAPAQLVLALRRSCFTRVYLCFENLESFYCFFCLNNSTDESGTPFSPMTVVLQLWSVDPIRKDLMEKLKDVPSQTISQNFPQRKNLLEHAFPLRILSQGGVFKKWRGDVRLIRGAAGIESFRTAALRHSLFSQLYFCDFAAVTGKIIHRQTAYRCLAEKALYAQRPAICVPLNPLQKREFVFYGPKNICLGQIKIGAVYFSLMSRFSTYSDSRGIFIWKESGIHCHPLNMRKSHRFGGCRILVLGSNMLDSRTSLHIFDAGSVTAQRYKDEVLEPQVRLFREAIG